ncbi:MAG: site-specific DNA-methyltransferase [Candidatus Staskawiczbacteria bacterium]|nr:site-specific DNA-methyltransferase [Candidatus Staskawiczbacteria bacterium]
MSRENFSEWSKQDLIDEVKKLKKRKKYGIVWEDKPEKVVTECKKKIPILKEDINRKIEKNKDGPVNILIEGDNYHALTVLNYTHKEKIDVIYIDPPYNTGAKTWKYNNDYVDGEDAFRHSKWLSFMEKRLKLSKNLLKNDGIICLTIDENEQAQLKLLCDEIFGEYNYLGTICIRNNPSGRTRKSEISLQHEYAIFYSKNKNIKGISPFYVSPDNKTHNYKQDENGKWYEKRNLRRGRKKEERPKRYFPIFVNPKSLQISITNKPQLIEILPVNDSGHQLTWDREKEKIEELYRKGEIWAEKIKKGYQIFFKFRPNFELGESPKSLWIDPKYSSREHGIRILKDLFGESPFEYPKSLYAVIDCITSMNCNKEITVLDFFAGSGTTAHAVLELNERDEGKRRFIICTNNENKICEEICYPRVKKVIEGYKNLKGEKIEGLKSNLSYYKTDFVETENLDEAPDEDKINLTYKAGEMIAIREDTLEEKEKNDWWQIFESKQKLIAIYFQEDKSKLQSLVEKLGNFDKEVVLYIFSWGKNEYANEFTEYENITVKDIPEPLIEVYKEVAKL